MVQIVREVQRGAPVLGATGHLENGDRVVKEQPHEQRGASSERLERLAGCCKAYQGRVEIETGERLAIQQWRE